MDLLISILTGGSAYNAELRSFAHVWGRVTELEILKPVVDAFNEFQLVARCSCDVVLGRL